MKGKTVSFLLALIMLLSIPAGCWADGGKVPKDQSSSVSASFSGKEPATKADRDSENEYYLPEVGITITVPDDYYILTRDVSASDPVLSLVGFTQSEAVAFLENNGMYLNAMSPDGMNEIVVTMTGNPIQDMNKIPDSMLDAFRDNLKEMFENIGVSVDSMEVYRHDPAKFLVFHISQDSDFGKVYGVEYSTIYDNKTVNLTFHSYDGAVSAEEEKLIKTVVDSMVFDAGAPAEKAPVESTDPIDYKNPETGVEFTVPANWHEAEFSKDRTFLKAKFASNDGGAMILYGYGDLWEEMTIEERASIGFSRFQLNMSSFTDADLEIMAEALGNVEGTFSKETINGTEYCRIESGALSSLIDLPIIIYMTVENGYIHQFQYQGYNTESHDKEFMNMLNSVKYESIVSSTSDVLYLRKLEGEAYGITNSDKEYDKKLVWSSQYDSYYDLDSDCYIWYNDRVKIWQYWYQRIYSDYGDYGWMEHYDDGWFIEASSNNWIALPEKYDTSSLWYIEDKK